MKTGTITFHAPNNNGSFLQAYPQLFNLLYNPFLFVMLPYLIDCIANIERDKHIKMYRRICNE